MSETDDLRDCLLVVRRLLLAFVDWIERRYAVGKYDAKRYGHTSE
jgi:hypothetical protein